MKKFLSAMILVAAIVFVVAPNGTAEARDVYIRSYSDGDAVYLMTETVQKHYVGGGSYTFTVKVGSGSRLTYIDYEIYNGSEGWGYENSEGYRGSCYDGSSPIAAKLCDYLRQNF